MTIDEQAIHDILRQLESAWNSSDSAGFVTSFAEDANFIHIFGGQLDGRPAIEASHRRIFDTIYKGSRATFTPLGIRFVRPDVAVVFSRAHLKLAEGSEPREFETRPTMVVAKEQRAWKIVAFQNTKISEIPAAAQPR